MRWTLLMVLALVLIGATAQDQPKEVGPNTVGPGETGHNEAGSHASGPLLAVYQAKDGGDIQGCWLMDTPEGRVRITIWKQGHYTFFGRLESPSWLNRTQGEDAFAVESNDKYPPGVYRGSQYAHNNEGLTLSTALEIVDQGGALSYRLFERYDFDMEPVSVQTMTPCP